MTTNETEQKYQLRALWTAVITQAFDDSKYIGVDKRAILDRSEARAWLTGHSKDFLDACSLAEVDPDYIRKNARDVIEQAKRDEVTKTPRKRGLSPNERFFEHDGKTLNIIQWADLAGISYTTMLLRLKQGYTISHILDLYLYKTIRDKRAAKTLIEHDGKSQSISNWSKDLKMGRRTLERYISQGLSIKEILELRKIESKAKNPNLLHKRNTKAGGRSEVIDIIKEPAADGSLYIFSI
ncbi:hypothetical protein [Methylocapsa aurea]|uniref:hypothetical protein n=1 Tax=Methylocapsa aurea TaxID=663610 RepID=UPI0005650E7F|nr:hypothetical protein [Methylocapsa aurea]